MFHPDPGGAGLPGRHRQNSADPHLRRRARAGPGLHAAVHRGKDGSALGRTGRSIRIRTVPEKNGAAQRRILRLLPAASCQQPAACSLLPAAGCARTAAVLAELRLRPGGRVESPASGLLPDPEAGIRPPGAQAPGLPPADLRRPVRNGKNRRKTGRVRSWAPCRRPDSRPDSRLELQVLRRREQGPRIRMLPFCSIRSFPPPQALQKSPAAEGIGAAAVPAHAAEAEASAVLELRQHGQERQEGSGAVLRGSGSIWHLLFPSLSSARKECRSGGGSRRRRTDSAPRMPVPPGGSRNGIPEAGGSVSA